MQYCVFSGYTKGYAHKKRGMNCEDYAAKHIDPYGKYAVVAISDGHSAPLCFRSDRGASFGCNTAIDKVSSFFDQYYNLPLSHRKEGWVYNGKKSHLNRLKKSIVQAWNKKVEEDILKDPFTEKELASLKPEERRFCESPYYHNHAYGATLIVAGMCEDFYLLLHIGDGAAIVSDEKGEYSFPLGIDSKSAFSGAPTSLPDADVLYREDAFRGDIFLDVPFSIFLSSDGIADFKEMKFKNILHDYSCKILKMREWQDEGMFCKINNDQQEYLQAMLEYYADRNKGPEDDCSLSGIIRTDIPIPDIQIGRSEAESLVNTVICTATETRKDIKSQQEKSSDNIGKYNSLINELKLKKESLEEQIKEINKEISDLQDKLQLELDHRSAIDNKEKKVNEELQEDYQNIRTKFKGQYEDLVERIKKLLNV